MRVPAFFYGSYMDADVLRRFGADPRAPTPATLPGWRLTFTPHANLVPDPDGTVHGLVFKLPHDQLDRLYGPDGYVTSYKPVPVVVGTQEEEGAALTFVEDAKPQRPDGTYLDSFLAICQRVGLPPDYIRDIRQEAERVMATAPA